MAIATPRTNRREYWRLRRRARGRAQRAGHDVTLDESAFGEHRRGCALASHPGALCLRPAEMRDLCGDCCVFRHRHGADSYFLTVDDALALLGIAAPASQGIASPSSGSAQTPTVPALLLYVAQLLLAELDAHELAATRAAAIARSSDASVRERWAGLCGEMLSGNARNAGQGGRPPSLPRLDTRRSGAEFWVQRRSHGQPINWHWDKDEQLRDATGMTVHPLVSTVTYLTRGGAPTVVLGARISRDGQLLTPMRPDPSAVPSPSAAANPSTAPVDNSAPPAAPSTAPPSVSAPGPPTAKPTAASTATSSAHGHSTAPRAAPSTAPPSVSAWLSYPRVRKLLRFDGGLLHGCPPELAEPSSPSSSRHGNPLPLSEPLPHHSGIHACPPSLSDPLPPRSGRLTLLINIWRNHTPVGLRSFPPSTALRLRCRVGASRQLLALRLPATPTDLTASGRGGNREGKGLHEAAQGGKKARVRGAVGTEVGATAAGGNGATPSVSASPSARLRVPVCDGSREIRLSLPLPQHGSEQRGDGGRTSGGVGRGAGEAVGGAGGAAGVGCVGQLGKRKGGGAGVGADASTVACGQVRCEVRRL